MNEIVVPAVIRGQVIADNLVGFGGRGGEMEFLSPDPDTIINQLPLRNPGEMRRLYTLTIDEIIDFLVELGQRLDVSTNEFMQEALEQSYAATELTPSILRWQYSLIQDYFTRDMVKGFIDVPIVHMSVKWWRTLHPGPVVMRSGGVRELPESMHTALWSSLLAFTLVFVYFVMRRVALERLQGSVEAVKASREGYR